VTPSRATSSAKASTCSWHRLAQSASTSIKRRPALRRARSAMSGGIQRADSSWNTTKSSAGAMPITTSRSFPHSWWAPNRTAYTLA